MFCFLPLFPQLRIIQNIVNHNAPLPPSKNYKSSVKEGPDSFFSCLLYSLTSYKTMNSPKKTLVHKFFRKIDKQTFTKGWGVNLGNWSHIRFWISWCQWHWKRCWPNGQHTRRRTSVSNSAKSISSINWPAYKEKALLPVRPRNHH